jgi:hypothetical protein
MGNGFSGNSARLVVYRMDATLLPIHLQIPLAGILSECLQSVLHC